MDAFEEPETQVKEAYNNIRTQFRPSSDIHLKLDSCATDIMKGCLSEVELDDFDGNAENARLYITLDRVCSVNIQCLYLQIFSL